MRLYAVWPGQYSRDLFRIDDLDEYITVDVWMDCGCRIRDIRAFAAQMREQRGWDVAVSSGWGGGGDSQYVRFRRTSLD